MYHKNPLQIKTGLFFIGLIIVFAIFWVNGIMIKELRQDARGQVENLAQAYSAAIHSEHGDIQPILNILLPSINFPIIITFNDEIYAYKNIQTDLDEGNPDFKKYLWQYIEIIDKSFEPLPVKWKYDIIGSIHYGDPIIVSRLKWIPYFEVGFSIIFLLLSFWGFKIIRDSEKNYIWAGMARETAHQLGTPISSLLGWLNLLDDDEMDRNSIITSMVEDINRLSDISDRFYKIGTSPKFKKVDLTSLSKSVKQYITKRIPKHSNVKINIDSKVDCNIKGDKVLLIWAFENLVKNSLDACDQNNAIINISMEKKNRKVIINLSDNGIGIPRKNWSDVFKPGFSSKERGWGLGLSLTRRIIEELHNGSIRVIKSRPGATLIRIILS